MSTSETPHHKTAPASTARKATDYLEPKNWTRLDAVVVGLVIDRWAGLGWGLARRLVPRSPIHLVHRERHAPRPVDR